MNIGIDARFVAHGVGRYVRELIPHLAVLAPEHVFHVIVADDPGYAEPFELPATENVRRVPVPAGLHSPRSLIAVSVAARRLRLDLFHATSYAVPYGLHCPVVVTLHDLCLLRDRSYFPPAPPPLKNLLPLYYRGMNARAIRRARRILTVSRFAKEEILQFFPRVDPSRIAVAYNGVSEIFQRADEKEMERIRAKYELPRSFMLFVGTVNPRKNLAGVVDAFALLMDRPGWETHLVAIARKDPRFASFYRRLAAFGHPDRLHLLDYVPTPDLPALYSAATALVFPSFHESFGLPVVEAFACGTPVLTSNGTALREVAGGAALLVDPASPREIMDGCIALAENEVLRRELAQSGMARARDFSWAVAARETLAQYRKALQ